MTDLMKDTATIPAAALPIPVILMSKMKPERIQNQFHWLPEEQQVSLGKEMRAWGVLSSKQLLLRSYRFTSLTEASGFSAFVAAAANEGDHEVAMQLDEEHLTVQLAPFSGNLLSEDEFELARRIDREYRDRKRSGRV